MTVSAALSKLVEGRRYTVRGEEGLRYIGQIPRGGLHTFKRTLRPAGIAQFAEGPLLEWMAKGEVIPEPPDA